MGRLTWHDAAMGRRGWLTRATSDQGWSWKTRIWAVILVLFGVLLANLPLFSVVGFEFALALAVLGTVLGADLGSSLVWRARLHPTPAAMRSAAPLLVVIRLWAGATALSAVLLLLPLLVVSIAAFWLRNCDWLFGLKCFVLMPVLSAGVGAGIGVLAGILTGTRKKGYRALPFLVLFAGVMISLAHFYNAPAVFSYNAFAGYIPGNLYDEGIDLRAPFFWARLFHFTLLFAAASTAACFLDVATLRVLRSPRPRSNRRAPALCALLSFGLALSLFWHSGSLGFSVSKNEVQEALPGLYESDHFVIHYAADPQIADEIETIADDHEFRRAQLVRDMGVDPSGKIHSYYFANVDQKQALMGARNVYMAKPWRHEIYMNYQPFPHQVLRHEIAHVLAGSFGDSIFEVSAGTLLGVPVFFNVGMIEGTAVAADWPDHFDKPLTPHQSVKAMHELDMVPPVHRLFSTGFLAFSSARSYTVAGSYLRFLIDQHGMAKVRLLYQNGGDFADVYGVEQSALTAQWRELIAATVLPEGAAEVIRERFRRRGILSRPCPHAIARARQKIWQDAAIGDYQSAIRRARSVCRDVPGEPNHQLELASLLWLSGELKGAEAIYRELAGDKEHLSSTLRSRALFKLADIAMRRNERSEAQQILEEIAGMPLPDNSLRQARVMLQIMKHQGPAGPSLRAIFWNQHVDRDLDRIRLLGLAAEAAAAEPNYGLTHYLVARQLRGHGDPNATRRALTRAMRDTLGPLVEREAARLLAEAAYLAKDYDEVERAAEILVREAQPEVIRLLGYDWYERAHWGRTGAVPAQALGWRDGVARSGHPVPDP